MSEDPYKASRDAFERKPLAEKLDILLSAWRTGSAPAEWPWLSQGVAQSLLQRLSIEQTVRLVKVTERVDRLTMVLIALTAILAVPVVVPVVRNLTSGERWMLVTASHVAVFLVLLSIVCALISNVLNAQVMGKARLGVAVLAPPEGSPQWKAKVTKLWWADLLSWVGIGFAVVSAVSLLFSSSK